MRSCRGSGLEATFLSCRLRGVLLPACLPGYPILCFFLVAFKATFLEGFLRIFSIACAPSEAAGLSAFLSASTRQLLPGTPTLSPKP